MPRKSRIVFVILIVSGVLFLGSFLVLRSNYTVPIIMYHSVNPVVHNPLIHRLIVDPEDFERQMRFLKSHRYNVVLLSELARMLSSGRKLPPKTIAITFDDGYKDIYTYAFPVLKKYNLHATNFVIIDEVGRALDDRLSWDQIKEMRDSGLIEFGSHAMGPEPLTKIPSQNEVRRQIFLSKEILEKELGLPAEAFSYPEGRFNADIRQLVINAGYKIAVATKPGRLYPKNDLFALRRLRISSTSHNLFVFWFETTGFYNFLRGE